MLESGNKMSDLVKIGAGRIRSCIASAIAGSQSQAKDQVQFPSALQSNSSYASIVDKRPVSIVLRCMLRRLNDHEKRRDAFLGKLGHSGVGGV